MDTLDAMRVFARVAETGSFTRAAHRSGISTALASKWVKQLEDRLGARLLDRTTRRAGLTEVGRAYYDRCLGILESVAELEDAVARAQGAPRGHLRVTAPRVFGEDVLVDCVRDFVARYPEISVDLSLEERLVDIVAEGFDVAVRIGELPDSSLIARRITSYRYVLCAAPEYVARAGAPERPEALARHRCIVNTAISPANQWEFLVDGRRTTVTVPARLRVNTARPVRQFALAGQGIGLCLLPTVREDIDAGRLLRLLEAHEAYERSVSVVYPHSRHLSPKVRAFVDHLVAAL